MDASATAMQTATTNDLEANRQLAIRGYDLFKKGDIPGILAQSTDDIEWLSNEIPQIPFAGTFNGKQGVVAFFTKLNESVEVLLFEPQEFIAERDKVVAIGFSRARVRHNGITYDDNWVHTFTMRDGMISRFRVYGNSAAAVAAFTGPAAGLQTSTEPSQEDIAASMAH